MIKKITKQGKNPVQEKKFLIRFGTNPKLLQELKEVSRIERRSINKEILFLIEKGLENRSYQEI